jgi:hypothetical protein
MWTAVVSRSKRTGQPLRPNTPVHSSNGRLLVTMVEPRSSIPDEEQTDVPGKAAREVEHPRGKVKAARLQIAFPS